MSSARRRSSGPPRSADDVLRRIKQVSSHTAPVKNQAGADRVAVGLDLSDEERSEDDAYLTDDAAEDIVNEQLWSLSYCPITTIDCAQEPSHVLRQHANADADAEDDAGANADADAEDDGDGDGDGDGVKQTNQAVADNPQNEYMLSRFASSCSPEQLGSRYAVDQVVASLVRWHCEEKGIRNLQDSKSDFNKYSCRVEEMLFRRNVSVHCTVTRMDMAAKRQVLSAMRQQPHTQDAIVPWLGASIAQICSYQLMSKGLPAYAPGQAASQRAQEIINSLQKR